MVSYKGVLDNYFETGCEGIIWILIKDNMEGHDSIEFLKEGDHLKVFSINGDVLFDDVIKEDHEIGYTEYPLNPGYGQPCALGYWIHWTQAGWQPDDWAQLFFHNPPLKAEITRK